MAAVSNMGSDLNWAGNDLAMANAYSFGRLAWNPSVAAADVLAEWVTMTWGMDPLANEEVCVARWMCLFVRLCCLSAFY